MQTGIKQVKISDAILKAMEMIGDKSKWTKGTCARNDRDVAVMTGDPAACKFCMIGALDVTSRSRSSSSIPAGYILSAANKGKEYWRYRNIPSYNDVRNRSHEQVMDTMMTAAFLALADGK